MTITFAGCNQSTLIKFTRGYLRMQGRPTLPANFNNKIHSERIVHDITVSVRNYL